MTEDFLGQGGRLEEVFVGAQDGSLQAEVFTPFTARAKAAKPHLLPGLAKLEAAMGQEAYSRLIDSAHNINLGAGAVLIVAAGEAARTALVARYLGPIKEAFQVDSVRIIGGGRFGVDAF